MERESVVIMRTSSVSVSGKVVEYLVPVMSKDLLCKFPDNSAYGFDYSQSSIWSPLIPHPPPTTTHFTPKTKKRKLFSISPKVTSPSAFKKKRIMRPNKKKVDQVSVVRTPSCNSCACLPPFATKGLNRVLRAATKHLKKKMRRDSLGRHVKLCNYLEGS